MKRFLALFFLILTLTPLLSAAERYVLFLAGSSLAPEAGRGFKTLVLPQGIRFRMVPDAADAELLRQEIGKADLIIANGLVKAFRDILAGTPGLENKIVHLMGTPALRARIPEKLLRHCRFPMDETALAYRTYGGAANLRNLVLYIVNKEWSLGLDVPLPEKRAAVGIINPFSGKIWHDAEAWFAAHPFKTDCRGRVAVLIYGASATAEKSVFLRPLVDFRR